MPSSLPSWRIRIPVWIASSAAEALDRSMGTCPAPVKKARWQNPFTPRPVKYSALARNVTRRFSDRGMKIQSAAERWLLARIAAPAAGTFSVPSARGRKTSFTAGPIATNLRNQ
jgi:hypothetical protein